MKKTYIIPEMMVVTFITSQHLLINSVASQEGLDDVSVSNSDFGGGEADVKASNSDIWDNVW